MHLIAARRSTEAPRARDMRAVCRGHFAERSSALHQHITVGSIEDYSHLNGPRGGQCLPYLPTPDPGVRCLEHPPPRCRQTYATRIPQPPACDWSDPSSCRSLSRMPDIHSFCCARDCVQKILARTIRDV